MDGGPRKVEVCYGPSPYRTQCLLPLTAFADVEPLCRPQADAMDGGPRKVEVCYGP